MRLASSRRSTFTGPAIGGCYSPPHASQRYFALQLYTPPPLLTKAERRDFKRDERVVARGLKSILDAGLALKDIRDRRLYKEHTARATMSQARDVSAIEEMNRLANSHWRTWSASMIRPLQLGQQRAFPWPRKLSGAILLRQ
jgi:hypothetical protein